MEMLRSKLQYRTILSSLPPNTIVYKLERVGMMKCKLTGDMPGEPKGALRNLHNKKMIPCRPIISDQRRNKIILGPTYRKAIIKHTKTKQLV